MSLFPDLPVGGDYGSILSYFVLKGIPTFRFVDMPANMAVVAYAFVMVDLFFPLACSYVFLDNSLIPQDEYYIYRYIQYGYNNPVSPFIAPAPNSSGPLTMIYSNTSPGWSLPQYGFSVGNICAPYSQPNPLLALESTGSNVQVIVLQPG